MTDTILNKMYEEPERPYSQKEIQSLRSRTFSSMRIGETRIEHPDCRHFYYAKKGGRKEKETLESKEKNIGKCSVCWKLHRTPRKFRNDAESLVRSYCTYLDSNLKHWTHYDFYIEKCFYVWLYKEFSEEKPKRMQVGKHTFSKKKPKIDPTKVQNSRIFIDPKAGSWASE